MVSSVPGGGARRDDENCGSCVGESAQLLDLVGARAFEARIEAIPQDEKHGMLAVGGAIEFGLYIDSRRGREGEAVANVDISLGWRGERWGLRVDGSGIGWFDGRVGDFADGLLELGFGDGFGFGQGCIAFEGESVDGLAAGVASGDLSGGCDLEGVFGEAGR